MSPIISTLSNSWSSGGVGVKNILGGFQGSSTSSIDKGGLLIYHGSHAEQTYSNSQFSFTVDETGTFYIAMIGGCGAVQTQTGINGNGGIGILQITVPASAVGTRFYVNQGGAGRYETAKGALTALTSAAPGGGKSGIYCGTNVTYSRHTGGGAMTTISANSNSSNVSQSFAVVGGGGGGGATGNDGSSGGGFDMQGTARESTKSGGPGTTLNGGVAASASQNYGSCAGTQTAGGQWEGGNGSGSTYDSGAGGGSGYYGGGGGVSGGGYNAGNGGGGSGKLISSQLPTGVTMSIAQISGTNLTDDGHANTRNPWGQLQSWITSLVGQSVTIPANTSGEEYGQKDDTYSASNLNRDGSAGCAVVWTKQ